MICSVCNQPILRGQRYFKGFFGKGPLKHQFCSMPASLPSNSTQTTPLQFHSIFALHLNPENLSQPILVGSAVQESPTKFTCRTYGRSSVIREFTSKTDVLKFFREWTKADILIEGRVTHAYDR